MAKRTLRGIAFQVAVERSGQHLICGISIAPGSMGRECLVGGLCGCGGGCTCRNIWDVAEQSWRWIGGSWRGEGSSGDGGSATALWEGRSTACLLEGSDPSPGHLQALSRHLVSGGVFHLSGIAA